MSRLMGGLETPKKGLETELIMSPDSVLLSFDFLSLRFMLDSGFRSVARCFTFVRNQYYRLFILYVHLLVSLDYSSNSSLITAWIGISFTTMFAKILCQTLFRNTLIHF